MQHKPKCIYHYDTVGHAAELILVHKIGGSPVLDAEERLLGIVTGSNLLHLLAAHWRADSLIFSGAHQQS